MVRVLEVMGKSGGNPLVVYFFKLGSFSNIGGGDYVGRKGVKKSPSECIFFSENGEKRRKGKKVERKEKREKRRKGRKKSNSRAFGRSKISKLSGALPLDPVGGPLNPPADYSLASLGRPTPRLARETPQK